MIDLIIRRRRPKCVNVHWLWLFLWRGRDETSRYSAGRISAKSLKDPISRKSLIKPAAKMYRTNLSGKHYTTNAPKNSAVHFAQIYQGIRFILFILVQTIRSWHKIDRLALSIIYPIISFLNWFSSNANDQLKKSREISFPFVGRRLNWTSDFHPLDVTLHAVESPEHFISSFPRASTGAIDMCIYSAGVSVTKWKQLRLYAKPLTFSQSGDERGRQKVENRNPADFDGARPCVVHIVRIP